MTLRSEDDVREDLIRQLRDWAGSKQNQHGRGGLIDQAADELAHTGRDLLVMNDTLTTIRTMSADVLTEWGDHISTHYEGCWKRHVACFAYRVHELAKEGNDDDV